MDAKTCTKCGEAKAPAEFHRDKSRADGLNPHCKCCLRIYYQLNRVRVLENAKQRYATNAEDYKEKVKARYYANPEAMRAWARQYAAEHREEANSRAKKWYVENTERGRANARRTGAHRTLEQKEKQRERARAWAKAHPAIVTAKTMQYIAAKKRAAPTWVPRAAFLPFYEEAARLTLETGIKHHVDHIVPLQGKTVSGLHVPWNLRVIPWMDNIKKGNKLLPELLGV